ncbi:PTS system mannose/fructose/sorbose family transporter subunit IID [Periweissella cryptocerci]|uniref:PTS system mannose/fructose/sorbose family transporter subunit IID n=1 Tax=Periweissella cryptocerci TaxID=2506420 RepID=A0A4P6YVB8_9LACO|nr:PTS system mannose/fructose/sorbose family transporter subunit IID [Periweissella cryptocerci]QBO36667.1 PTS system mannose/fructose/sorbose family transporter subunit IID [Periweissella cryptocerci]
MDESKTTEKRITKKDLRSVWWRSTFLMGAWNYERMQNIGWAFSMVPAIKRLYKTKEDRAAAMHRHLEFFNTHPYAAAPILGVEIALEEQRANGADINDEAISGVKVGMMGPLAGVGDPVFWGTLRPVVGAFAASLALSRNVLGPILFFVIWNVLRMSFTWFTQNMGYTQGTNITQNLGGGMMQKITQGASILGMFIMGVLVPRWTTMNFPVVISSVKNEAKNVVDLSTLADAANRGKVSAAQLRNMYDQIISGKQVDMFKVTTLQDVFNTLIPGLMPLLLMFGVLWLLRHKVSPILIIVGLFVLGIAGYGTHILG